MTITFFYVVKFRLNHEHAPSQIVVLVNGRKSGICIAMCFTLHLHGKHEDLLFG